MRFSVHLREYLGLVGWVFLLSAVFYPFELLAPAEEDQPIAARLINLAYVPLLWQTHKFHHSETALNCTTQTRVHFLSHALFAISYIPVLVLLGSQAPHFIALFVLFRLWGFVNHMNVRLNIGPLTAMISGPQWHRIHHSIRAEHQNKNFATYFPFIDILFGTYYKPAKHEYPPSGLVDDYDSGVLREATIAPFLAWKKPSCRDLGEPSSSFRYLSAAGLQHEAPDSAPGCLVT